MKAKFLFLFLFCPLFLFSQTRISGQVFDKETKEPISGVVVYTQDRNRIAMTDEEGRYILNVHSSEPVYFKQLAYDFLVTVSDILLHNPNVYLIRNVVELSEVVISPIRAENLINKALKNLALNLQKKEINSYLFHIEETTSIGGEREAFALVEAKRTKTSWKKSIHWDFFLYQLDKIKTVNESSFYINKKPIYAEFFPQEFSVRSILDNFICELYENEEEQLVIKASPKHPDKKNYRHYIYTINKQDTVLIEVTKQSYSNSAELTLIKVNKDTKWQITNQFSNIKFSQDKTSDLYYIKEIQHLGNFRVISDVDSSYDESFKSVAFVLDKNPVNQINTKKKIKPYDYILFESDFPNSHGFWKQYIKP
ncbi:hypothetical protein FACS189432_09340 [Bacteroidia bacterium]|nr:hypothetical protein FACS189426_10670 [Bacteroidia bacterium]GHT30071.1 hypothetical protein FACS189432_09340 [Bacteroidia bacterium]